MPEKRVVITGIGPLTSIGIGKDALWKSLVEGKTNVKLEEWKVDGDVWEKFYIHKIDDFNINSFGIDKSKLEQIKEWKQGEEIMDLYYLLAAAKLAIDDSKLEYNPGDNNIGCVVAHENAGLEQYFSKIVDISFKILKKESNCAIKKQFAEKLHYDSIRSAYDMQTFMVLFHILKTFNIHGYSLFVNNACSSGLYALETASQIIKSGRCPAVLTVAGDYPRINKYLWFKDLDMYAKDGKIRPFTKGAKGFVFGDGAVGFVLEDFEHAKKRGAKIYAEYLGGGFSQEGWKITIPYVGSNYYQKAIKEAIEFSNVNKDDIDLLVAHGTGNSIIDRYEAKAITDIFGSNPKKPLITTFKPYIGHNLGGSALLETALLLLCLENNLVLPVLNTNEVDPRMKIDIVKEKIKINLKFALKISCAFAGYNAAAIFKKI
ncbi:MAG: beta-ketoacyl synthase N-terminal-like domain-containing protein [Candidatus Omnitrophota bacterium]|nr:beta-ketoacyl synthase N-terminal-like domain-containing protein [Candidatus Omnitrophota bacterium]